MLPHHDQQTSEDRNQTEHGQNHFLLTRFCSVRPANRSDFFNTHACYQQLRHWSIMRVEGVRCANGCSCWRAPDYTNYQRVSIWASARMWSTEKFENRPLGPTISSFLRVGMP